MVVIVGSCSMVRSCLWIIATPLPGFGDGYVYFVVGNICVVFYC